MRNGTYVIEIFRSCGMFHVYWHPFCIYVPRNEPTPRDTPDSVGKYEPTLATNIVVTSIIGIVAIFALVGLVRNKSDETVTYNRFKYLAASIMASIVFAVGLIVSQMTFYSKIFGFLDLSLIPSGQWDPTLIMVMGGGFAVSLLSYQWVDGFNLVKVRRESCSTIDQTMALSRILMHHPIGCPLL